MDERTLLLALHETEGIGWKTIHKLVTGLSSLQELPAMKPEHLIPYDLSPAAADRLYTSLRRNEWRTRLQDYKQAGIRWMTVLDPDYPELLRQTSRPPWILYARGDLARLHDPGIALVGTRTPTVYGRKAAFDLASDLSSSGVTVVSGLARGIDTEAHRGAVRHAGRTIAVLACGLDRVYPPENASLFETIAEQGLLVSEFAPGTTLHPGLFPLRNRIIAGLTLGTVVVEAAAKSGSLITADQALDESRDVFAVPGPITSPKSAGTLSLLRQGAKLVASVEDILEEYPQWRISAGAGHSPKPPVELTPEEERLLSFCSFIPVTTDFLLEQSGYEFGHLHSLLLSLTMKNVIQSMPGSAYVRL